MIVKKYELPNFNLTKALGGNSRKKEYQTILFLPIAKRTLELKLEQPELYFVNIEQPEQNYHTFDWTQFKDLPEFKTDLFFQNLLDFYAKFQQEIIYCGNLEQQQLIKASQLDQQFQNITYSSWKNLLQQHHKLQSNDYVFGYGYTKTYQNFTPDENQLLYQILTLS